MKILKLLVIPAFLLTLQLGPPPDPQSAAEPYQTASRSGICQLTEFNALETDNKIRAESNNHGVPLLDSVLKDNGVPLLDAVIKEVGIPLLDVNEPALEGGKKQ